jgi:uncharacterized tellurite resistance protein B-like protein
MDALSRDERLLLIKFVCAFAWTDLEIRDGERRFVERLMHRLELDESDRSQAEHWLHVAPSPSDVDPSRVPVEHRRTFVEAVRAVIYADGNVETEEREQLERLRAALGA